MVCFFVFFFKQKTAYEMRISDWSSDVCSSDLARLCLSWKSASGSMPTRASSGRASSRMRPFGMAMISGFVMMRAPYLRARKRATRGCLDSDALSACQFHHILPCHAPGSAAEYGGPLHRLMRIDCQAIMQIGRAHVLTQV